MASASAPLALANGSLSIDTATAADAGVLSAADWQAFHGKVSSLSGGAGIDVGGTAQAPTVAVHFGSGGAVADGDSRLSDARAPLPGSSLYIQNGTTAQNASINVSGDATIGGNLSFAGTLTGDGSHLSGVPSLSAANVQFTGAVAAGSFSGNGSSITSLNANNIGSGTVSSAHLPLDVAYYDAPAPQFTNALSAGSLSTSGGLTVSGTGGVTISGTGTFSGDGSGLGNLSATNLASGKVADNLLSGHVPLLNSTSLQTFSGAVAASSLSSAGNISTSSGKFSGDGSLLTALDASKLSTNTVPDGRLAGNVCRLDATTANFTGSISAAGNVSTSSGKFSGDGSLLSSLNADNLASGHVADGRLSTNVALYNATAPNFAGTLSAAGLTATGAVTAASASISGNFWQSTAPLASGDWRATLMNSIGATVAAGSGQVSWFGPMVHVVGTTSTLQPDYSYYYLLLWVEPVGVNNAAMPFISFAGTIGNARSNLGVGGLINVYGGRGYNALSALSINFMAGTNSFSFVHNVPSNGKSYAALMYDSHLGPGILNWWFDVYLMAAAGDPTGYMDDSFKSITSTTRLDN